MTKKTAAFIMFALGSQVCMMYDGFVWCSREAYYRCVLVKNGAGKAANDVFTTFLGLESDSWVDC